MATNTDSIIQLSQSDIIGLIGAAATILIGILTWFISAAYARKTMQRKELQYRIKVTSLVNENVFKEVDKLEIKYKENIIDELLFLELDIINSGNVAIVKPPMKIEAVAGTYIIPAYFEDVPDGYDDYWEIVREDGETCLIDANHINPGQIIKARFLMDQMPSEEPIFTCPMPDLVLKRTSDVEVSVFASKLLEVMYPNLANALKLTLK
ncbi:hypothetical protein AB4483_17425 [Vibrio splendidus]